MLCLMLLLTTSVRLPFFAALLQLKKTDWMDFRESITLLSESKDFSWGTILIVDCSLFVYTSLFMVDGSSLALSERIP